MNVKMLWMSALCAVAIGAVLLARSFGYVSASWAVILVPLACLVGHCLPMFLTTGKSCHSGQGDSVDSNQRPDQGSRQEPQG